MKTPERIAEQVKEQYAACERAIQYQQKVQTQLSINAAFIIPHLDFLNENGIDVDMCNEYIDFNWPDHNTIVKIISHFGGDWEKSYGSKAVDYTTTIENAKLRIYGGEPPPQCRIVEEIILVPAHEETRYKIVCNEGLHATNTEDSAA